MTTSSADEIRVINDTGAEEFQIRQGEHLAFLEYRRRNNRIHFIHTEVPVALRGKGIADLLARTGMEFARAEGLAVVVHCPFVATYLKRHPEYQPLVQT